MRTPVGLALALAPLEEGGLGSLIKRGQDLTKSPAPGAHLLARTRASVARWLQFVGWPGTS